VDDLGATLDDVRVQAIDVVDPELASNMSGGTTSLFGRAATPSKRAKWTWQPSRRAYP
jgi:hypothetical protein